MQCKLLKWLQAARGSIAANRLILHGQKQHRGRNTLALNKIYFHQMRTIFSSLSIDIQSYYHPFTWTLKEGRRGIAHSNVLCLWFLSIIVGPLKDDGQGKHCLLGPLYACYLGHQLPEQKGALSLTAHSKV